MSTDAQSLPRQAVLVLVHPDGYIEAFADRNIDVHLARVPVAHSREAEQVADDCVDRMLPPRYRDLRRADMLRATGTTRPLRASSLLEAAIVREILNRVDTELVDQLAVEASKEKIAREKRRARQC